MVSVFQKLLLTENIRNIDKNSLAIIDELGRGTSSRDGLAIALSIAEALVDSRALVFFATHFRELGKFVVLKSGPLLIILKHKSCLSESVLLTFI